MAKPKQKYYAVWKGRRQGIFDSWADCAAAVSGYPGAEYKAFGSLAEAQAALRASYADFRRVASPTQAWLFAVSKPLLPSLCVDAACDGSPGKLEYRGVDTETGRQLFHVGPYPDGTNNLGEFLAIALALEWMRQQHRQLPVYSDSRNAITWARAGKCRTKLARTPRNGPLFDLMYQAEDLLRSIRGEGQEPEILKWDTAAWGENPADFGRK